MIVQTHCWHPAPDHPGGTKGRLVVTFSPSLSPERSAPPPTHPLSSSKRSPVKFGQPKPDLELESGHRSRCLSKARENKETCSKGSAEKNTPTRVSSERLFSTRWSSCHLWLPLESCSLRSQKIFLKTSHLMPLVCFIHSGTTRARFS